MNVHRAPVRPVRRPCCRRIVDRLAVCHPAEIEGSADDGSACSRAAATKSVFVVIIERALDQNGTVNLRGGRVLGGRSNALCANRLSHPAISTSTRWVVLI